MSQSIGYYVHHQGDGHRQRALAIAHAANGAITVLGTGLAGRTGEVPTVEITDDRLSEASARVDPAELPASLHYAPVDLEGVRRRVASVTRWIADTRPRLLVVDVSVEIAMLARLASVPIVYVRLNGHRTDRPHRDVFRSARALLAPFHADLDDERTPEWVRRKSFHAPGIVTASGASAIDAGMVLGVVGRGGGPSDGELWAAAARAVPDLRWCVIGPCTVPRLAPPNLELRGWVDHADRMVAGAGVVVGAAGDGLVGSVIAHRRPFICLPEPRPFDEQVCKARRLSAVGAAIMCDRWPAPGEWPDLLRRARAIDRMALARLDVRDGADRAARWLQGLGESTPDMRTRSA